MADLADRPAVGLPYGTLKRIEIARALAARPKLLLLDEPAAGLTHSEVDELGELVRAIRDEFALTRAARRAPHGDGHGDLRQDRRARLRLARSPKGAPAEVRDEPARHRGLPRSTPGIVSLARGRPSSRGGYGAVRVLHGLDFTVDEGEVVVILGANGAGKTTTLRAISGMIDAQRQRRASTGATILGRRPEQIAAAGHRARSAGPRHDRRPHRRREPARSARTRGATREVGDRHRALVRDVPAARASAATSRPAA